MKAFKMIYQQYEHTLLRTAMRLMGHIHDAEDAVQSTFLKLYRNIQNFKFKSKFSTYLFRILINTCFDLLKEKKKYHSDPLEWANPSYTPEPAVKVQLENAIGQLPHKMRTCFVLFAIEEFKQQDIADMLDLSLGAVKSNIFHAKSRLREKLAQMKQEGNHEL